MNPTESIYIINKIGLPAALGQLAEECCELGQAALKLQRVLEGKNPTPVTEEEARKRLAEEATDVSVVLALLCGASVNVYDDKIAGEKVHRWKERIENEE